MCVCEYTCMYVCQPRIILAKEKPRALVFWEEIIIKYFFNLLSL